MSAIGITKSIFSKNMSDIILDVGDASECPISILGKGMVTSFVLQPINKKVTLHTSDIIECFNVPYDPFLNKTFKVGTSKLDNIIVRAGENNAITEYNISTIFGGYDKVLVEDESEFISHNFLTWRPQTCYTVQGIKERLTFAVHWQGANLLQTYPKNQWDIQVRVYLRDGRQRNYTYGSILMDNTRYIIDCSLDNIIQTSSIPGNSIAAYDIYGINKSANDINICPQRFIVREHNSSYTYFHFQNSLGGYDTITATGAITSYAQGETQTSSVHNIESEIENNFVKSWEVNTGYITSDQEENFWHEFLRSTSRYILFNNGTYRKIIIEEYKAERTKHKIESFTFKFHYAEKTSGEVFIKEETLPEYTTPTEL